jgi:hypothetical protein
LSAGLAWHPIIGYVRLSRFMLPWGRLYFVLDQNLRNNPLRRGEYGLLRILSGQYNSQEQSSSELPMAEERLLRLKLVVACLAGAVLSFIWRTVLPRTGSGPFRSQPSYANQPPGMSVHDLLFHWIGRFPVNVALIAVFILLAIYERRRSEAWIFAFLAGMAIPYFFF